MQNLADFRKTVEKRCGSAPVMDKKLREPANLCVEMMKSKRQVKGQLSYVLQIRVCR